MLSRPALAMGGRAEAKAEAHHIARRSDKRGPLVAAKTVETIPTSARQSLAGCYQSITIVWNSRCCSQWGAAEKLARKYRMLVTLFAACQCGMRGGDRQRECQVSQAASSLNGKLHS